MLVKELFLVSHCPRLTAGARWITWHNLVLAIKIEIWAEYRVLLRAHFLWYIWYIEILILMPSSIYSILGHDNERPSQWEMSFFHWLGANLESALWWLLSYNDGFNQMAQWWEIMKVNKRHKLHAALWLPILVIHIRCQVKTRQCQSYNFSKIAKN